MYSLYSQMHCTQLHTPQHSIAFHRKTSQHLANRGITEIYPFTLQYVMYHVAPHYELIASRLPHPQE